MLRLFVVMCALFIGVVAKAEHSLTVPYTEVVGTSVKIHAYATGTESLGVAFNSAVCDAAGINPVAGSSHTFTTKDTIHVFTVDNVSETVLATDFVIGVSEADQSAGCNNGDVGYASANSVVSSNPSPPLLVPVLPLSGIFLLAGLLGVFGLRKLRG